MNALTPETLARAEAEDAAALESRRAKREAFRQQHEADERAERWERILGWVCTVAFIAGAAVIGFCVLQILAVAFAPYCPTPAC